MRKAEELYMKHIYTTGGTDNKQETPAMAEVMINEVDAPWKTPQYSHRPWKNREGGEISSNSMALQKQLWKKRESSEILPNSTASQRQFMSPPRPQNDENSQLPRGSYTHILVNPTQLSDMEFTAWMDRLVEARRNRKENKPRPYRQFRKSLTQKGDDSTDSQQQGLRNKLKPPEELNTEELMAHMRCEYTDIEEAVDMYNLNVEECRSA